LFTADAVTPKNRATSLLQYPIFLAANWQNSFGSFSSSTHGKWRWR
jgi:hypothetical protein